MRFRGLDLNLLVVLDALFETRSVTKAGKRLNLSQSATSSALSRLRAYFNDELLVVQTGPSGTKEMATTAFGKSLAEPVRFILAELQTTLSQPASFDLSTCNEHIRIIAPDFIEILLLARVARGASELAPLMTFEFSGGGTNEEAVTELNRNIADFMIAAPQHLAPGHPSVPLLDDTSVCLGSASNALLERPLSREAFLSLKRIELNKVHSDRPANFEQMDLDLLKSSGVHLKIDNLSILPHYLVNSEFVCLVPFRLALHFAKSWPLRFATIDGFDQQVKFDLQWNRSFARDPARAWFRDFVIQTAREIGEGSR